MNTLDSIIAGLRMVQEALCVYPPPSCDCKFGASMQGEETGCPEIRQAITYLEGLPAASKSTCKRSDVVPNLCNVHFNEWPDGQLQCDGGYR